MRSFFFVLGWVLSFLSLDLRGTSSVSQFRIWFGAWGQKVVGFPYRFFRVFSRFLSCFMVFLPICCYEPVLLKTYLLWDVSLQCTAHGTHPSVGSLSPLSKKLTCSDWRYAMGIFMVRTVFRTLKFQPPSLAVLFNSNASVAVVGASE